MGALFKKFVAETITNMIIVSMYGAAIYFGAKHGTAAAQFYGRYLERDAARNSGGSERGKDENQSSGGGSSSGKDEAVAMGNN